MYEKEAESGGKAWKKHDFGDRTHAGIPPQISEFQDPAHTAVEVHTVPQ